MDITDFVVKYWLEILFGLVVSGVSFLVKHHLKLMQDSQKQHEQEMLDAIHNENKAQEERIDKKFEEFDRRLEQDREETSAKMSSCYANMVEVVDKRDERLLEEDKSIRDNIAEIKEELISVKKGTLAMQGKEFKEQCAFLLDPAHEITLIEYENIVSDHEAYHALGGNHEGDAFFRMVEAKFKKDLVK